MKKWIVVLAVCGLLARFGRRSFLALCALGGGLLTHRPWSGLFLAHYFLGSGKTVRLRGSLLEQALIQIRSPDQGLVPGTWDPPEVQKSDWLLTRPLLDTDIGTAIGGFWYRFRGGNLELWDRYEWWHLKSDWAFSVCGHTVYGLDGWLDGRGKPFEVHATVTENEWLRVREACRRSSVEMVIPEGDDWPFYFRLFLKVLGVSSDQISEVIAENTEEDYAPEPYDPEDYDQVPF